MPTSGDLKSVGSLFFSLLPPQNFNGPPFPPSLTPNGNDLGHYMKSYMNYILSKFEIIVLMPEIILDSD